MGKAQCVRPWVSSIVGHSEVAAPVPEILKPTSCQSLAPAMKVAICGPDHLVQTGHKGTHFAEYVPRICQEYVMHASQPNHTRARYAVFKRLCLLFCQKIESGEIGFSCLAYTGIRTLGHPRLSNVGNCKNG